MFFCLCRTWIGRQWLEYIAEQSSSLDGGKGMGKKKLASRSKSVVLEAES